MSNSSRPRLAGRIRGFTQAVEGKGGMQPAVN
jgi:hypothetical protein